MFVTLRGLAAVLWSSTLILFVIGGLGGSAFGQAVATGQQQDSLAAWAKISEVLTHPRCLNCHQLNTPLQGDARRVHVPSVVRGVDDMGAGTMRCHNCHGAKKNNKFSGVPGAPHWKLAPVSMLWEAQSSGDLCRMIKDPARNGKREPEALIEHMETEGLVLWGWNPGEGRTPIPMPHSAFVEQMKIWVNGGGACPP